MDSFKNNPSIGFTKNLYLEGLDSFKKTLEKHFFAEVTLRNRTTKDTGTQLAIEVDCNLTLLETLCQFNSGVWGNFGSTTGVSPFESALSQVRESNDVAIEIEEFSIFLQDTSVIINKIYPDSIPAQLKNIFTAIGKHYVSFTTGLKSIPFEIYVPVFEETENKAALSKIADENNCGKDYFAFWGLYFYTSEEAMIYDVKQGSFANGDLYLVS